LRPARVAERRGTRVARNPSPAAARPCPPCGCLPSRHGKEEKVGGEGIGIGLAARINASVINGSGLEPAWTQDPPLEGTNRQRLHIGQVVAHGEASIASVEAVAGPAVSLADVDQDQAPVGHTW
jgi:hypothetical protein